MAWKEIDHKKAKSPAYDIPVLTITPYQKSGRECYNGVLSQEAMRVLGDPKYIRVFSDNEKKLVAIEVAAEGFKITKTAQPQHMFAFSTVMKEFDEIITGSFSGSFEKKKLVFDLKDKIPQGGNGQK